MPIFRVSIELKWGTDEFSNDFKMNAADVSSARAFGLNLAAIIQGMQFSVVTGNRVLASPIPDRDRSGFSEVGLSSSGSRDSSGAKFVPFDTCVELLLNTATGLPGSKLIRGAIHASDLTVNGESQLITAGSAGAMSAAATAFNDFITTNPGVLVVGKANRIVTSCSFNDQAVQRAGDNKWHNRRTFTPAP